MVETSPSGRMKAISIIKTSAKGSEVGVFVRTPACSAAAKLPVKKIPRTIRTIRRHGILH
jgi:hypothetical protein